MTCRYEPSTGQPFGLAGAGPAGAASGPAASLRCGCLLSRLPGRLRLLPVVALRQVRLARRSRLLAAAAATAVAPATARAAAATAVASIPPSAAPAFSPSDLARPYRRVCGRISHLLRVRAAA